jgi:hypothetical protein
VDAGVILGAIGTASGLGSLAWGIYAWRVERRDRKAEVADERAERKAERAARQHAEITMTQDGSSLAEHTCEYYFTLTNLGPSYAKRVSAWLAQYERPNQSISDALDVGPLNPGQSKPVTLQVRRSLVDEHPSGLFFVRWSDESGGPYDEPSRTRVRLR